MDKVHSILCSCICFGLAGVLEEASSSASVASSLDSGASDAVAWAASSGWACAFVAAVAVVGLGSLSLSVLVSHDGEVIVIIGLGLGSELDASVLLWLALLLLLATFSSFAFGMGRLVDNAKVVILPDAGVGIVGGTSSSSEVQLSSESWLFCGSPLLLSLSWASWLRT